MVRLSLPRPAHPRVFQHSWVRPSSGCYPTFILAGRRSRGFASAAPDLTPRLRLGFPSAPRQSRLASPVTASRRIIMQKARDQPLPLRAVGLSPLVGMWFQVHYPPLVGVLPTFRSRYWFAIGHQRVLSLTGWSPQLRTTFHVHGLTQDTPRLLTLSFTGLSPALAGLSRPFN